MLLNQLERKKRLENKVYDRRVIDSEMIDSGEPLPSTPGLLSTYLKPEREREFLMMIVSRVSV